MAHNDAAAIVLVHGLWVNGLDMTLLKYRLAQRGQAVYQFRYHSVLDSPADNARRLGAFIQRLQEPQVHLIGHSLGGLVIRHYFAGQGGNKPAVHDKEYGRIVTLGTPHQASQAARQLLRCPPAGLLLGKSIAAGLAGGAPAWDGRHKLGSIAGVLRLGLGLIVPGIEQPNDGTVRVAETHLVNMADHLIVKASHFGLLLSKTVAEQCLYFIQHGRFEHGDEDCRA